MSRVPRLQLFIDDFRALSRGEEVVRAFESEEAADKYLRDYRAWLATLPDWMLPANGESA